VQETDPRLRTTQMRCEGPIWVANNAFALRQTQTRLQRTRLRCEKHKNGCRRPKIARARRKIAPDDAKRLIADFFALVSNANALQTLQTESLRTYRSSKQRKRTANALIAVQTTQNGLQRTHRSCDWIER